MNTNEKKSESLNPVLQIKLFRIFASQPLPRAEIAGGANAPVPGAENKVYQEVEPGDVDHWRGLCLQ